MNKRAAIESLLFVAGEEGLSVEELASVLEDKGENILYQLMCLQKSYLDNEMTALQLKIVGGRYELVTKKTYAGVVRNYAIAPFAFKLSQAALETLAIIAYKQPVTRLEIDEIRGVQSGSMLQKLESRGLIEASGRRNSPGRPMIYQTTQYFMDYFGLEDQSELPDLSEIKLPNEEEIQSLFKDRSHDPIRDQDDEAENKD